MPGDIETRFAFTAALDVVSVTVSVPFGIANGSVIIIIFSLSSDLLFRNHLDFKVKREPRIARPPVSSTGSLAFGVIAAEGIHLCFDSLKNKAELQEIGPSLHEV